MLDEPVFEALPTSEDFYYDGELDEKWARNHYLGKDIEFARKRYESLSSLSVLHDWSHVGAFSFRYYILGACRYLQTNASKGDADVYNGLAELLLRNFVEHPDELRKNALYVSAFSDWAVNNYEKFDIADYEYIYGDVRGKYAALRELALQAGSSDE